MKASKILGKQRSRDPIKRPESWGEKRRLQTHLETYIKEAQEHE